MKIIISENQLRLLNEALGVPDNILEAADKLYDVVINNLKTINTTENEYNFDGRFIIVIGDKKKVILNSYTLKIVTQEIPNEEGVLDITSMAMGARFAFNRDKFLKEIEPSGTVDLTITFAVGENWEPNQLYEKLEDERDEQVASLAHELKHKYDKQVKTFSKVGSDAKYQATQQKGTFAIPVIDNLFYRYMYFIHGAENLVRPTEVAYSMKRKNITKSQFKDFIENNRVYKELLEIRNFTFEDFISELEEQEERMDKLIEHIGEDPSNMTIKEKIDRVLEIVYIDLVNNRMDLFVKMTQHGMDDMLKFGAQIGLLPKDLHGDVEKLKKTDQVRQKFLNQTVKYQNNPTKFFEDEFEKFNYVANKMIKKIIKLYSMAEDDKEMTESIQNWELHQQIMEKKYGKRKIDTKYKNWNFK